MLRVLPGHKQQEVTFPWRQRESLFRFLKARYRGTGRSGRRSQANYSSSPRLPDEDLSVGEEQIRFAPGALDGLFGSQSLDASEVHEAIEKAVQLIGSICKAGEEKDILDLYGLIKDQTALVLVDPVITRLTEEELEEEELYQFCRWLVEESPDREPVKFGLALLGCFAETEDRELFLFFGMHEEFTLYASIALVNASDTAKDDLWTLAKQLNGWGRIHVIERLVLLLEDGKSEDEPIRRWLLLEGFRNSVSPSYSALSCATYGQLAQSLSAPVIDLDCLKAIAEIMVCLFDDEGIEGVLEYPDLVQATEHFIEQMRFHLHGLVDLCALLTIREGMVRILATTEKDLIKKRRKVGLTKAIGQKFIKQIDRLVEKSPTSAEEWAARVRLALEEDVHDETAYRCAYLMGIDVWDIYWRSLAENPVNAFLWEHVMNSDDPERLLQATEAALTILPYQDIASGPKISLGLGQQYELHNSIDAVLNPSDSVESLIPMAMAALKSPSLRNRSVACHYFERFEPPARLFDLKHEFAYLAHREPDQEIRSRLVQLAESPGHMA